MSAVSPELILGKEREHQENVFTERVVRHWNRLPRGSGRITIIWRLLKNPVDVALSGTV